MAAVGSGGAPSSSCFHSPAYKIVNFTLKKPMKLLKQALTTTKKFNPLAWNRVSLDTKGHVMLQNLIEHDS